MSDPPLVPDPVYGLRTWTVVTDGSVERLAGPHHRHAPWPPGGAWLEASCAQDPEHEPPAQGCGCGLHAWHPSKTSARRVLASRRQIPGIVEAQGAIELHADGFRAERARPYAFLLLPGRNARLVGRLAELYGGEVIEARGADDVLAFCRSRGLGLDEATVAELLGPATAEHSRRARREKVRADAFRLVAALAVVALLVVAGLEILSDPPGERVLKGRTGEIHVGSE